MVPRKNRFFGRRDPRIVLKHGKSARSGPFGAKYLINKSHQGWRVAVIVSTKISKSAPVRNRIRRRVYEAFRLNPPTKPGTDIVVSVYDVKTAKTPADELTRHIKAIIDQIN